eukprot:TRINITY_DN1297_c0_g1_i1.p1 TRINITY_DN1297_c0_g1~~TRINITY_DN1297_c0_g1_i1.p1  ORF type:complete len:607 (+),score=128.53 TRINITY_DN1297_c0_g1_i1:70-1821(+)
MQGLARVAKKTPSKKEEEKKSIESNNNNNVSPAKEFKEESNNSSSPSSSFIKKSTRQSIDVGKYKLGEQIGKGAYSTVFKALNVETGHFVAVKRIKRKKNTDDQLKMEIGLLKTLSHENIVQYIDLIVTDQYINLVLEFVDSGSLSNVIESYGSFPEPLVALYIEQVLLGLGFLHHHGIIHRDIKGPNLLITKEGIIKLADFGIAMTSYVEDNNATFKGSCVEGSPFWMAPELISVGKATAASDVWSLACTIIELITGYPPYFDNSGITALYRMVNDPRPPFPEEISSELQDFLEKCFKKEPDIRPTVRDLLKHSWILKYSKSGKRENWGDTLRKVKTYNTAKREQAIRNIQNVANMDWSQIQQPSSQESVPSTTAPPTNVSGAFGAHNQSVRRQMNQPQSKFQNEPQPGNIFDKVKNSLPSFNIPGTPTPTSPTPENANRLMSIGHNAPANLEIQSKKLENNAPLVSATTVATEARRNFLYSYTVYKIKVTTTPSNEQPKSWFIFRSLSDFTEQEEKLRKLPNAPQLPELPKLKRFGGNDPDYVAYMQQRIEEYLVKLMKIDSLHKPLLPFLSHDPTPIPAT